MRFSERMGYAKPKPVMGLEEIDDSLKVGISKCSAFANFMLTLK